MSFPLACPACQKTMLVDLERPEKRNLSKLAWEYGFTCPACGAWRTLLPGNRLVDVELEKLKRRKIDRHFPYHFQKALKRITKLTGE